jgi:hypothetical protein
LSFTTISSNTACYSVKVRSSSDLNCEIFLFESGPSCLFLGFVECTLRQLATTHICHILINSLLELFSGLSWTVARQNCPILFRVHSLRFSYAKCELKMKNLRTAVVGWFNNSTDLHNVLSSAPNKFPQNVKHSIFMSQIKFTEYREKDNIITFKLRWTIKIDTQQTITNKTKEYMT